MLNIKNSVARQNSIVADKNALPWRKLLTSSSKKDLPINNSPKLYMMPRNMISVMTDIMKKTICKTCLEFDFFCIISPQKMYI